MADRSDAGDERLAQLRTWLHEQLGGGVPPSLIPASTDASFRRYFRMTLPDGGSAIAMDSPPTREDPAPFVRIAGLLRSAGLHVPRIRASDVEQGYLLLEDLGSETYLERLADCDPEPLIHDALDALVQLQAATQADELPRYDETLLRGELDLFTEWYVRRHLRHEPPPHWWADWENTCTTLIAAVQAQPAVWVHRDFTPRNLMLAEPNPGVIDFQDAVLGPVTYDWVSLVRDAFISWPLETERRWLFAYRERALAAGIAIPSQPLDLQRAVDFTAAQRHLKVIGIFARLYHRDGKTGYLADVPRFLRYLERETADWPELAPLRAVLAHLPAPVGSASR